LGRVVRRALLEDRQDNRLRLGESVRELAIAVLDWTLV